MLILFVDTMFGSQEAVGIRRVKLESIFWAKKEHFKFNKNEKATVF